MAMTDTDRWEITILRSRYTGGDKEDQPFYDVTMQKMTGDHHGVGMPCDTREEVIEAIQKYIDYEKSHPYDSILGRDTIISMDKIDFTNTIPELQDITLAMFFNIKTLDRFETTATAEE